MRGSKDLISGRGKLILLSGIGGIGKTALAQTFAAESENADRLIYWANCWEREGTPPYWHWIQLLRQAMATLDQNTVAESLRRSIDYIRRLVPSSNQFLLKMFHPNPLRLNCGPTSGLPETVSSCLMRSAIS
jgi:hypothetical protein